MTFKNHTLRLALLGLMVLALYSCVGTAKNAQVMVEPEPQKKEPVAQKYSPEEDQKALESYGEILKLTISGPRKEIVPKLEAGYRNIIATYPNSYLAQESYWRLIIMSFEDYSPPKVQRAESLYAEFIAKYPKTRIRVVVDDTMVRFYYKNRMWKELERLCAYYAGQYVSSGVLKTPMFMFLYSEAKFNQGNMEEARKGYNIVLRHFPASTEATMSRERIKDIKERLRS